MSPDASDPITSTQSPSGPHHLRGENDQSLGLSVEFHEGYFTTGPPLVFSGPVYPTPEELEICEAAHVECEAELGTCVLGDHDGDGKLTLADSVVLRRMLAGM